MKKISVTNGFFPDIVRTYNGEHIYPITEVREVNGVKIYRLPCNAWVKDMGADRYVTDWNDKERWGRVDETETDENGEVVSTKTLGFMILRVDRSKGIF